MNDLKEFLSWASEEGRPSTEYLWHCNKLLAFLPTQYIRVPHRKWSCFIAFAFLELSLESGLSWTLNKCWLRAAIASVSEIAMSGRESNCIHFKNDTESSHSDGLGHTWQSWDRGNWKVRLDSLCCHLF